MTAAARGRASRRRGVTYERDVIRWLRDHGAPHAERTSTGRAQTRGDLDGIPGVHIELRNRARLELAAWLDEVVEAAGTALPLLVVKRRGTADRGQDYAVLRLADPAPPTHRHPTHPHQKGPPTMTTTTTTSTGPASWLDERARTIAATLGLPVDRLDQHGDPYRVPEQLRGAYADVLTGTPLAELFAALPPATPLTRVHVAESVVATVDPAQLARVGHAEGGGPVPTSIWQLHATTNGVADWVDRTLAEHRIDLDAWRRHTDILARAARRHTDTTRAAQLRDTYARDHTCVIGGHVDDTTRPRLMPSGAPAGAHSGPLLCDGHALAVPVEVARRYGGDEVRRFVDELGVSAPVPTPADVVPRRGLFRG